MRISSPSQLALSCGLVAAALATTAIAAPTSTTNEQVVPRSYTSGGLTCYYSCPATTTNGYPFDPAFSGDAGVPGYYICTYDVPDSGGSSVDCFYNKASGAFLMTSPNTAVCTPQAELQGCGPSVPAGGQFFKKRSLQEEPRQLSEAEAAIAKRQFKPKSRAE